MASPKKTRERAGPAAARAKSIGHYILGKTIGEGTFGKVKLGTHILTGEKVAVKILEKERIVDVADVERVAREIHILKLIQSPHVIQLYEIIETPRQLYLITEYCSGGELFDHIVASGRVREKEACRFFHQIIGGVEHIHRQSVVHRDLKPENLLLDDHRNIKIVDFGLSNTFQEGQLLKTACGSPCYAAPEMIAGQRYVPSRCDIWSCGVILFALVCGYLPFEDGNTANLYRKILHAEYQAPKFISDGVRDLIARMLNTDPEQRYTIPRVRQHAWYRLIPEACRQSEKDGGELVLEEDVLEQLDRFGFPRDYAERCLQMNKHNHVTTTYYLLAEKKRRLADRMQGQPPPTAAGDLSGGAAATAAVNLSGASASTTVGEAGRATPESLSGGGEGSEGRAGGSANDMITPPKPGMEAIGAPVNTAADADRAGGASMVTPSVRPLRTPEPHAGGGNTVASGGPGAGAGQFAHWAQALGGSQTRPTTNEPQSARCETPGERRGGPGGSGAVGDAARRGAASAEPPVRGHAQHQQQHQHHPGAAGGPPNSARSGVAGGAVTVVRRQSGDNATPRSSGSMAAASVGGGGAAPLRDAKVSQPSPRKRAPLQQATGFATPRGPVPTPPLSQSATPSRSGAYGSGPPGSPATGGGGPPRSTTPGRRAAPGGATPLGGAGAPGQGVDPLSARSAGPGNSGASRTGADPLSARSAGPTSSGARRTGSGSRPLHTQGAGVVPVRPSGSATARSQNEARRRHYTAGSPAETPTPTPGLGGAGGSGPGSARGGPNRPASPAGQPGRNLRATPSPSVAGAAMGDFSGGGSTSSRAVVSGGSAPTAAWAGRQSPGVAVHGGGGGGGSARASSASPEAGGGAQDAGGVPTPGAMSARDARDEAMRTCRGAFNVSCTSSKAPKQIMQEIHRSLTLQRVSFKQASSFLVRCQRQGLRFEMEISHLDHLESIYVVRFRRVAGELSSYKDLCSKVLAEMKM